MKTIRQEIPLRSRLTKLSIKLTPRLLSVLACLATGFIASQSSAVTVLWTKQWGSSADDYANNLTVDGDGSIYVGGSTAGAFAGQTNPGADSPVVSKFSPDGTFVWARIYGSGLGGESAKVVSDGAGTIYAAGRAIGSFGGQTAPGGGSDFYLRKFDSNGNTAWTRIWGSTTPGDVFFDSSMGGDGLVYLAGFTYASSVVFRYDLQGSRISTWEWSGVNASGVALDPWGNCYVVGRSGSNCSLTKFNPAGSLLWSVQWGPFTGWPSVSVDAKGNVYAAAVTTGVVGDQSSIGGNDANLTKFSTNGVVLWTRTWGSTNSESAGKPNIGPDGNIYVAGGTTGSFDGQTNSGGADCYVTAFAPDGTRLWTKLFGTSQDDYPGGAIFDSEWNLLVSGVTRGAFPGRTNLGGYDLFLMKWALVDPTPPVVTNQPISGTVSSGGTATLTVGVTGTPPFTYQWQFNGVNIAGATNASLDIPNFSVANAGGYSVSVSNSVGGVTSSIATLASVDIAMFAGVIVNGPLGSNYLIQAASSLTPTVWSTLTNVALPTQPYIYIDYNSPTNAKQFYRALPQ